MFQFRRFPSYTYLLSIWWSDMSLTGLLHSEICGSQPTYGSPQLIAVSHVLLRLSVPRHSPCALCSLTIFFNSSAYLRFCCCQSSLTSPLGLLWQTLRRCAHSLRKAEYEISLVHFFKLENRLNFAIFYPSRNCSIITLLIEFVSTVNCW